jgi:hypothetical protein
MKKQLLLVMLATGTLCTQSCSKKDELAAQVPVSQLIQGTWRLTIVENNIPYYRSMPTLDTPTTLVNSFKFGDIVAVWTATTAEEYILGKSQGAVNYSIVDSTLTTTTAKGVTSSGKILTLTKDKLRILKVPIVHDSPSNDIIIFNYIR